MWNISVQEPQWSWDRGEVEPWWRMDNEGELELKWRWHNGDEEPQWRMDNVEGVC